MKEDNVEKQIDHIRHTLAHVLARAVVHHFPDAKLTLGPAIEDGFYYDFDFGSEKVGEDDLKKIQKTMKKTLSSWSEFTHKEVSEDEARDVYKDNPYKLELIDEISKKGEPITLYTAGDFTDLCRGGHTDNPARDISDGSWKLDRVAGAYWRGDEKNQMLTRIYGLSFESKEELDAFLETRKEAEKRDHRKLGKELDLFTFSELVGSGLPLFTPKGALMRDLIVDRISQIQSRYGYEKVAIPHITKKDLYETSGHWDKFKDELFHVQGKSKAEFVMKPMNCPHHTQIYAARARSYKELPIRYAETTMVYRDEQQGELLGLARVRSITQDDGHVFCTPEQMHDEVARIVDVVREFYTSLDMFAEGKYWVSLSVRDSQTPEKYLGEPEKWDMAEKALLDVLEELGLPHKRIEGEAAFYGPKIDFMFKDALGRERQLATAQLDFVMPERFGLEYTDTDGVRKTPVMIHRAIAGSLERFMAVMIEHFAGAFPLWISPVQIAVIPVAQDAHGDYAQNIYEQLKEKGLRAVLWDDADGFGKRIRRAKNEKIPYTIIAGDKDMEAGVYTLESRDEGNLGQMKAEEIVESLRENL